MKKVIIVLLSLAVTLVAQVDDQKRDHLQPTEKAIKATLMSDNNGAQNSGLYVLAQLKASKPEESLTEFNALLKNIASLDDSPVIRQNASLTFAFINSTILVEKIQMDKQENPNKFFSLLNRELKQDYLVYSE